MAIRDLLARDNAATAQGCEFGEAGKPHTYNPYRLTGLQARRHFAWLRGWKAGRAKRLAQKRMGW